MTERERATERERERERETERERERERDIYIYIYIRLIEAEGSEGEGDISEKAESERRDCSSLLALLAKIWCQCIRCPEWCSSCSCHSPMVKPSPSRRHAPAVTDWHTFPHARGLAEGWFPKRGVLADVRLYRKPKTRVHSDVPPVPKHRNEGYILGVATPAEPRGEKKHPFFVQILGGEKLLKFVDKCQ